MTVSVLMTAFNREKYIGEAIESVLASAYSDYELIIVDDCSEDRTVEIARSYAENNERVKVYVNEQNLGDYPNRNKAASYASGKYIKYLDSDDIMYKYCLATMTSAMDLYPEAGFGLSAIGDPIQPYPYCINPHDSYLENFHDYGHFSRAPGSSIIRKEAFDAVKGFSGKRMIGDYELWFKLARYYKMVKLPRDLVWDRRHNDQESGTSYAKNQYEQLRKNVLQEALSHPDCPLSIEERTEVLKKEKIKSLKQKIRKWL